MPRKRVTIPLLRGLDEALDSRITPPDRLSVATNVWLDKAGRSRKRPGYQRFESRATTPGTTAISHLSDHGPFVALLSTEKELCAVGGRRLFAFNEEQGIWYDRGPVSPCTGRTDRVFGADRSWHAADSYTLGGYTIYAGRSYRRSDVTPVETFALHVAGRSADGQKCFEPFDLISVTSTSTRPHGPKCAAVYKEDNGSNPQLLVLVGQNGTNAANTANLLLYSWSTLNPHLGPSLAATISSGGLAFDNYSSNGAVVNPATAQADPYYHFRTYDIVQLNTGDYILAYINTSNNIILQRRNSDHTIVQGPVTVTNGAFRKLALHHGTVDPGTLYMIAVVDNDPGRRVEAHARNSADLTLKYATATLHTLSGATSTTTDAENADHLGICDHVGSDGSSKVLWTFSVWRHQATGADTFHLPKQAIVQTNLDSSTGGLRNDTFNALALAKPFSRLGRFYLPCTIGPSRAAIGIGSGGSDSQRGSPSPGWNSAVLLEAFPEDVDDVGDPSVMRMAGIYHAFVAPNMPFHNTIGNNGLPQLITLRIGSLNAVSHIDDVERYVSARYTYWTKSSIDLAADDSHPAGTIDEPTPRHGFDQIDLDFDRKITTVSVVDGSAIVGGAMLTYYSGFESFELGYPTVPFIYERVRSAGSGYANSTPLIKWAAIWRHYDGAGTVHRSAPCPLMGDEVAPGAGGPFQYDISVNSYPGTHRVGLHAVLYADDPDHDASELQEPLEFLPNRVNANDTVLARDNNQYAGSLLYTVQNELGATAPEGAKFLTMALERIWAGGFFTRDRIQYSKPTTPGTAFEDAFAPEFSEGLGKLMPNGDEVTGISELDDKIVVFGAGSIFVMAGFGPDNTGANDDFSRLTQVSNDAGCIEARSVVGYPDGILFRSKKGIYRLGRDLQIHDVGLDVEDTVNAFPVVTSATMLAKEGHVRFTLVTNAKDDGCVLVYDYTTGQWATWRPLHADGTPIVPTGATVHNDVYYLVESDGAIWQESMELFLDDATRWVPHDLTSGWFNQGGHGGWQRIRSILPLMGLKDPCQVRVQLFVDFDEEPYKEVIITHEQLQAMKNPLRRLQPLVRLAKKCQAFKWRIFDEAVAESVTGEGFDLAGTAIEFIEKRGTAKVPAAQRV